MMMMVVMMIMLGAVGLCESLHWVLLRLTGRTFRGRAWPARSTPLGACAAPAFQEPSAAVSQSDIPQVHAPSTPQALWPTLKVASSGVALMIGLSSFYLSVTAKL